MHNKGAIPQWRRSEETKKGFIPKHLFYVFYLLMKMQWTFFFFGIVTLFIKRILRTETVRFDEINKSLSKWIWMNLNLKVNQ